MSPSELWDRLKNDLAFRVGTVYAGASWFVVEALDTLGMAPATVRRSALVLLVGFLVVVPAVWLLERRSRQRLAAGTPAAPGARARLPFRSTRGWLAAVVGLTVVALTLWGIGARLAARPVPEAATRLAVLPFQASGPPDVREYGVGMVNLLSAALSDVGGIRTIPSQTVLARIPGDPLSLDDHLALGEALEAGSVLTGSITAFGPSVRITGAIRAVPGGEELASAEVQGAVGDVLQLTDRLAVELLRALWRSRAPMPTVSASALTTTSPAALSAYLRGEAFLRGLREDSAIYFFERATQLDSTFALAWLRLADASGWTGTEDHERRVVWAKRALELVDRLPEREAALVRAYNVRLTGSLAAVDSLASYVLRYPDDPMGHYELGDARFHTAYLGRYTDDEITGPFLESVRLDPALAIGLTHVLDLTLDLGDSAAFQLALDRFARVATPERVASFRAEARVRWAPPESVVRTFAAELAPLNPSQHRREINQLIGALGNKVRLDPNVDPMAYIQAMDTIGARFGGDGFFRVRARTLRWLHFGTLGMADSVAAEIDRWLALDPPDAPPFPRPLTRAILRVNSAAGGALPVAAVAADVAFVEQHADTIPEFGMMLAELYNAAGTPGKGRALRAPAIDFMPPGRPDTAALNAGMQGWLRILQGDTVAGLRQLEQALEAVGGHPGVGAPGRQYGELLARQPERRAQGIRILRWHAVHHAVNTGRTFLELGRALDAEGDHGGAQEAYQHVLRLLHHADPFRRAEWEEARAALARLAVESPR